MDVSGVGGSDVSIESVLALRQQKQASDVGMGVMKKGLDLQKDLMAELFRSTGIGNSVDIKA